jgi:hypothetical protein
MVKIIAKTIIKIIIKIIKIIVRIIREIINAKVYIINKDKDSHQLQCKEMIYRSSTSPEKLLRQTSVHSFVNSKLNTNTQEHLLLHCLMGMYTPQFICQLGPKGL